MTPIWIWSNFYGQMLTHFVDALNQYKGQEKIEDTNLCINSNNFKNSLRNDRSCQRQQKEDSTLSKDLSIHD
jgi:hypothetical protein